MFIVTHQPSSCVAVFERQPFWGPELQRHFIDRQIAVRECRSLNDLVPAIREFSKAVMLIVLDSAPAECLKWLEDFAATDYHVPRIVVASAEFNQFEWLIRESGGIFVDDELPRGRVAKLCERHLNPSLSRR